MTMLDRMRKHRGWLKWSLALVVLAFIVFYIPDFLQVQNPVTAGAAAPTEVVAEIEGRELTAGDFQRRYIAQIQSYQNAYGGQMNEQLLRQLGIEQQILQQMIDEEAALVEAERLGIRISDEELAQQIFSIPGLQENGRFIGEARYEQVLRSQRPPLTKAAFEEDLRRGMMVERLRTAMTDWMSVSNAEVEREFRQRNEKVKLQVVALMASAFRDKVTVSDADIAAHYQAHQQDYRMGEQRRIRYLLIDRDQIRSKVVVTPEDVQRYYDDNIQQYQTPEQIRASHILLRTEDKDEATVRKQAEDVLKQARAGADFAELAKKFSEDEGSKVNGGDLDYFSRGRMVPEFENAAFAMVPGQISDLVKTQFGFHIIKLVDKKPGETRSLDELRPQIQEQLTSQRADQQVNDRATALGARIARPADLDTVGKEAGFPVQESEFFAAADPIPGLGPSPQVATVAFQLMTGELSPMVPSPRGPVFFTVTSVREPYTAKLDEVREKVREDVIRARATELSRERATQIIGELRAAKDFAAAAKAQGLEAKDTDLLTREAPLPDIGIRPEVDRIVFDLPLLGTSDPIVTTDGTVIARVVEKDEVTADELKQGLESFRGQLLTERRSRFFESYMEKAKQRMTIEVRNDVVRRVLSPSMTL
jgi:peptidyl-prolyl cis-trans isomerase D